MSISRSKRCIDDLNDWPTSCSSEATTRRRETRNNWIAFITIVVFSLIALSVAVLMIFLSRKGNVITYLDVKIFNVKFDRSMRNRTSKEFLNISRPFCNEINKYFQTSHLSGMYQYCIVDKLRQGENKNTTLEFRILFQNTETFIHPNQVRDVLLAKTGRYRQNNSYFLRIGKFYILYKSLRIFLIRTSSRVPDILIRSKETNIDPDRKLMENNRVENYADDYPLKIWPDEPLRPVTNETYHVTRSAAEVERTYSVSLREITSSNVPGFISSPDISVASKGSSNDNSTNRKGSKFSNNRTSNGTSSAVGGSRHANNVTISDKTPLGFNISNQINNSSVAAKHVNASNKHLHKSDSIRPLSRSGESTSSSQIETFTVSQVGGRESEFILAGTTIAYLANPLLSNTSKFITKLKAAKSDNERNLTRYNRDFNKNITKDAENTLHLKNKIKPSLTEPANESLVLFARNAVFENKTERVNNKTSDNYNQTSDSFKREVVADSTGSLPDQVSKTENARNVTMSNIGSWEQNDVDDLERSWHRSLIFRNSRQQVDNSQFNISFLNENITLQREINESIRLDANTTLSTESNYDEEQTEQIIEVPSDYDLQFNSSGAYLNFEGNDTTFSRLDDELSNINSLNGSVKRDSFSRDLMGARLYTAIREGNKTIQRDNDSTKNERTSLVVIEEKAIHSQKPFNDSQSSENMMEKYSGSYYTGELGNNTNNIFLVSGTLEHNATTNSSFKTEINSNNNESYVLYMQSNDTLLNFDPELYNSGSSSDVIERQFNRILNGSLPVGYFNNTNEHLVDPGQYNISLGLKRHSNNNNTFYSFADKNAIADLDVTEELNNMATGKEDRTFPNNVFLHGNREIHYQTVLNTISSTATTTTTTTTTTKHDHQTRSVFKDTEYYERLISSNETSGHKYALLIMGTRLYNSTNNETDGLGRFEEDTDIRNKTVSQVLSLGHHSTNPGHHNQTAFDNIGSEQGKKQVLQNKEHYNSSLSLTDNAEDNNDSLSSLTDNVVSKLDIQSVSQNINHTDSFSYSDSGGNDNETLFGDVGPKQYIQSVSQNVESNNGSYSYTNNTGSYYETSFENTDSKNHINAVSQNKEHNVSLSYREHYKETLFGNDVSKPDSQLVSQNIDHYDDSLSYTDDAEHYNERFMDNIGSKVHNRTSIWFANHRDGRVSDNITNHDHNISDIRNNHSYNKSFLPSLGVRQNNQSIDNREKSFLNKILNPNITIFTSTPTTYVNTKWPPPNSRLLIREMQTGSSETVDFETNSIFNLWGNKAFSNSDDKYLKFQTTEAAIMQNKSAGLNSETNHQKGFGDISMFHAGSAFKSSNNRTDLRYVPSIKEPTQLVPTTTLNPIKDAKFTEEADQVITNRTTANKSSMAKMDKSPLLEITVKRSLVNIKPARSGWLAIRVDQTSTYFKRAREIKTRARTPSLPPTSNSEWIGKIDITNLKSQNEAQLENTTVASLNRIIRSRTSTLPTITNSENGIGWVGRKDIANLKSKNKAMLENTTVALLEEPLHNRSVSQTVVADVRAEKSAVNAKTTDVTHVSQLLTNKPTTDSSIPRQINGIGGNGFKLNSESRDLFINRTKSGKVPDKDTRVKNVTFSKEQSSIKEQFYGGSKNEKEEGLKELLSKTYEINVTNTTAIGSEFLSNIPEPFTAPFRSNISWDESKGQLNVTQEASNITETLTDFKFSTNEELATIWSSESDTNDSLNSLSEDKQISNNVTSFTDYSEVDHFLDSNVKPTTSPILSTPVFTSSTKRKKNGDDSNDSVVMQNSTKETSRLTSIINAVLPNIIFEKSSVLGNSGLSPTAPIIRTSENSLKDLISSASPQNESNQMNTVLTVTETAVDKRNNSRQNDIIANLEMSGDILSGIQGLQFQMYNVSSDKFSSYGSRQLRIETSTDIYNKQELLADSVKNESIHFQDTSINDSIDSRFSNQTTMTKNLVLDVNDSTSVRYKSKTDFRNKLPGLVFTKTDTDTMTPAMHVSKTASSLLLVLLEGKPSHNSSSESKTLTEVALNRSSSGVPSVPNNMAALASPAKKRLGNGTIGVTVINIIKSAGSGWVKIPINKTASLTGVEISVRKTTTSTASNPFTNTASFGTFLELSLSPETTLTSNIARLDAIIPASNIHRETSKISTVSERISMISPALQTALTNASVGAAKGLYLVNGSLQDTNARAFNAYTSVAGTKQNVASTEEENSSLKRDFTSTLGTESIPRLRTNRSVSESSTAFRILQSGSRLRTTVPDFDEAAPVRRVTFGHVKKQARTDLTTLPSISRFLNTASSSIKTTLSTSTATQSQPLTITTNLAPVTTFSTAFPLTTTPYPLTLATTLSSPITIQSPTPLAMTLPSTTPQLPTTLATTLPPTTTPQPATTLATTLPSTATPQSPTTLATTLPSTTPQSPTTLATTLPSTTTPQSPTTLATTLPSTIPQSATTLATTLPSTTTPQSPTTLATTLPSTTPQLPTTLATTLPPTTIPHSPTTLATTLPSTIPQSATTLATTLPSTTTPQSPTTLATTLPSTIPQSATTLATTLPSTTPQSPTTLATTLPSTTTPQSATTLATTLPSTIPQSATTLATTLPSTTTPQSPTTLATTLPSTTPQLPTTLATTLPTTTPHSPTTLATTLPSTTPQSPTTLATTLPSTIPQLPTTLAITLPSTIAPHSATTLATTLPSTTTPQSHTKLATTLPSITPKSPTTLATTLPSTTTPHSPTMLATTLPSTTPQSLTLTTLTTKKLPIATSSSTTSSFVTRMASLLFSKMTTIPPQASTKMPIPPLTTTIPLQALLKKLPLTTKITFPTTTIRARMLSPLTNPALTTTIRSLPTFYVAHSSTTALAPAPSIITRAPTKSKMLAPSGAIQKLPVNTDLTSFVTAQTTSRTVMYAHTALSSTTGPTSDTPAPTPATTNKPTTDEITGKS